LHPNTNTVAYRNLKEFIQKLEAEGELIRIKEFVDPKLEISEITDRMSKEPGGGKALLFENTGTGFPVLINSMGSYKRMCLALGVNHLDDIGNQIEGLFKKLASPKESILDKLKMLPMLGEIASWMPKTVSGRGECQEVVMTNPDITKLPVLTCWPSDGGPFVTLPIINTVEPNTGIRNVGLYRMQVFGPTLTGMHWHKHKVSAGHFNEYKKLGKRMPVAVALGGDPAITYAATAPLPPNIDEYMLAGFIRKEKVKLVKCITQDMYVPDDADFIIEGYVDPEDEMIWEGPFGDHTGYYSLADWYPRFHITAITHRKDAVYPATIVGIPPQEDAYIGKATERIFIAPIKMTMMPEMMDMDMPIEGVFHNLTIIKIRKEFAGHGQKVMNAMWGAGQMMFNKILVVADEHANLTDYKQLAQLFSQNVDPEHDIYTSQGPMDVLDHSCSKFAFGGKMCIDLTTKVEEEQRVATDPAYIEKLKKVTIDTAKVKALFPEVLGINASLLKDGISFVVVEVEKNRKNHVRELNEKLFALEDFALVKAIIYVEPNVDVDDLATVIWRYANNTDARRDTYIVADNGNGISHIGLDGTRKTKELDNFDREWPNIICADDATIAAVDAKWDKLGLGKLIPSPSLRYKKQLYKGGAVAE
jgi:4-hydroxy-3-polyprenylbenzoate decarboxylase